jgi:hypothetical protein
MRSIILTVMLAMAVPVIADESVVHDDGTGAQISYNLPTHGKQDGQDVEYTTFRIAVRKDGKFLLFTDLAGTKTDDGKTFSGRIVIPSGLLETAEILMLGSHPNPVSSRGVETRLTVSTFKRIKREKSWTDQK